MLGFPIRTSPDHCLVDGFPELFAVTHVLHRFWAPRHPPLALHSLKKRCSCLLCSSQRATHNGSTHQTQHPAGQHIIDSGPGTQTGSTSHATRRRNESLKTEEKIKPHPTTAPEEQALNNTTTRQNPPVHQLGFCSNRANECSPTIRKISLERR